MSDARSDVQGYSLSARIELFVLDLTALGGSVYRFAPGVNEKKTNIVWQGDTYTAMPIVGGGFERTGQGASPRPTLEVSNIGAVISALCDTYDDLVGAKVTRKVVFEKYIDAVNFISGLNPNASADGALPDEIWFVYRKQGESRLSVKFELATALDIEGIVLPRRQVRANSCPWVYKSAECSYTGGPVAKEDDTATSDPAQDACGKRVASCKLRFGATAELPYGGFPAAGLLQ